MLSVEKIISDCHALGVHFSLDDFGTGYSSLTYLKRLSVTTLKIDQSFVRDMLEDQGNLSIVKGVIGLAAAFNRNVIAEGVETEAHGQQLLLLGCELAQGYAIARPMPVDQVEHWLSKWRAPTAWTAA
jgi:EAL domain-containing protein (putative c-di-GMP-specific phosphodiesterase class I)